MDDLLEFAKFFVPLIGAVIAWFLNERRKRAWDEYQRKVEHYRELLRAARGFYAHNRDPALIQAFIDQMNLSWLYCPDDVTRRGYAFLDTVHTDSASTEREKEVTLSNFVASIRVDLFARRSIQKTRLSGADFRHLRSV